MFALFFTFANAKNEKIPSLILPASLNYIDLSSDYCDDECLLTHLSNGEYGSFLARFDAKSAHLLRLQAQYASLYGTKDVAVLIPLSLKYYADAITRAISVYIISKSEPLSAKFFYVDDEAALPAALASARSAGAKAFILLLTKQEILNKLDIKSDELAYFPLLGDGLAGGLAGAGAIFGAISYEAQVGELLGLVDSLIEFVDESELSKKIDRIISSKPNLKIISKSLIKNDASADSFALLASSLNDVDIFLNLSLTKATFVANYLPRFGVEPRSILMTQNAYNPQLFSYIGREARSRLVVANSLLGLSQRLAGANSLFHTQIEYYWPLYSSILGFEQLVARQGLGLELEFKERVKDGFVEYETGLFKAAGLEFVKIKN